MSFLAPVALALGVLAVPVILMYVLKLRRQPLSVSSTLLWRRALDDVQANAPWQRLRPTPLLLLQLLALLALVFALAEPAFSQSRSFDGDLILIVDQSYGMQAHDVGSSAGPSRQSRFQIAQERARGLADSLAGGHVVSVIGMGAQPKLALADSSDSGAVHAAIGRLQPGVSAPNFLAALSLATSLARNVGQTRIVLLTSRESGISSLPIQVQNPVEIERIGGNLQDLGITAFDATPQQGKVGVVVRVNNFGSTVSHSDLELTVDGQLADVRPLSVGPGKEQALFWTLGATTRRLQAHLTARDSVTGDKTAWAVVNPPSIRHVLLVTNGDYFLQTALSLDPTVILDTVKTAGYRYQKGYDLTIFDRFLPRPRTRAPASSLQTTATLPPGAVLLVAPPSGTIGGAEQSGSGGVLVVGNQWSPRTITVPGDVAGTVAHILQNVDLGDVHVQRARALTLPGWLHPVAVSNGLPLLAAGEGQTRRLAVIPFDLQDSDWPLRISFPITIENLLTYLSPGLTANTSGLETGGTITFFPQPGTTAIAVSHQHVTGASASHSLTGVTLRQRAGSAAQAFIPFADTTDPGIYTARDVGPAVPATVSFAVNFFPPRPASASGPPTLHLGAHLSAGKHAVSVPVSVAWAFGLAALILLSAEWWYAFKR